MCHDWHRSLLRWLLDHIKPQAGGFGASRGLWQYEKSCWGHPRQFHLRAQMYGRIDMAGIDRWVWRRWRLRRGLNAGWGEPMMAQLTEVGAAEGCRWRGVIGNLWVEPMAAEGGTRRWQRYGSYNPWYNLYGYLGRLGYHRGYCRRCTGYWLGHPLRYCCRHHGIRRRRRRRRRRRLRCRMTPSRFRCFNISS